MTAWITCVNGLADGWGGALFRASWQGAIAIAFVWGICRGFPKIPARVRCWLWRLVYLKLLLALFWWQPVAELPLLPIPKEPPPLAELVAPPLEETAMPVGTSIERAIEETTPIGRGVEHVVVSAVPASPSPDLMAYLLLAWLLGVGWAAYLAIVEWRTVQRLRRDAVPIDDERVAQLCTELCERRGLARMPAMLQSDDVESPMLMGLAHPTIILPSILLSDSSPAQIRLMLTHELAHLQRRDLLWSWLPAMAHGAFFFNPLVWLANGASTPT